MCWISLGGGGGFEIVFGLHVKNVVWFAGAKQNEFFQQISVEMKYKI